MSSKKTIIVKGTEISIIKVKDEDYISLTDITRAFGDDSLIYNWMRNRNTLEFLGIWEQLNNPGFKGLEFETFKKITRLMSSKFFALNWLARVLKFSYLFKNWLKRFFIKFNSVLGCIV